MLQDRMAIALATLPPVNRRIGARRRVAFVTCDAVQGCSSSSPRCSPEPRWRSARDVTVTSFDGTPIAASLLPATGLGARRAGADDPDDARLGPRARSRRRRACRRRRSARPGGGAARGRLQRADVGLARVRRVGRDGDGRPQGLRGPRRRRRCSTGSRRSPRRGSTARAIRAPACTVRPTRAASSSWRRRSTRGSMRSRRRSRGIRCSPRSTARTSQRPAGARCSAASGCPTATLLGVIAPSGVQTGTLDPHILSALAVRRHDGEVLRRGQAVVRRPRAGATGVADPRADAADPGHRRHAVHALGGDAQLRAARAHGRAAEDGLVLRRARRLPDRRRRGREGRADRDRVDEAPPRGRRVGGHRAGVRVAGRRRGLARRGPLPAAARAAAGRAREGHAGPLARRHGLGRADRRRAGAQRGQRADRGAERRGPTSSASRRLRAGLQRHRRRAAARTCSRRSSTARAASCSATRRRRSRWRSTGSRTRSAARSRASRRAPARARATCSSSPAARRCTGRTRNAGTIDFARACGSRCRRAARWRPRRGAGARVPLDAALQDELSRRFTRAKVWVAGKRVKVRRRNGRLTAVVDLRGRASGRQGAGRRQDEAGKTRKRVHRYRTCRT